MKTIKSLTTLFLIATLSCMLLAGVANAATWNYAESSVAMSGLVSSVDHIGISATDLLDQKCALDDVYYLEARVRTLEDYNTVKEGSGYLYMTDAVHTESIWSQLTPADQEAMRKLTVYQAFLYIMDLPEYTTNERLKQTTDDYYKTFSEFMLGSVRMSLWRFVPYAVTKDLNPDQLCTIGRLIVDTETYQNLKQALEPLSDISSSEQGIQNAFSPAEIVLRYDEIASAARQIWPDIS